MVSSRSLNDLLRLLALFVNEYDQGYDSRLCYWTDKFSGFRPAKHKHLFNKSEPYSMSSYEFSPKAWKKITFTAREIKISRCEFKLSRRVHSSLKSFHSWRVTCNWAAKAWNQFTAWNWSEWIISPREILWQVPGKYPWNVCIVLCLFLIVIKIFLITMFVC